MERLKAAVLWFCLVAAAHLAVFIPLFVLAYGWAESLNPPTGPKVQLVQTALVVLSAPLLILGPLVDLMPLKPATGASLYAGLNSATWGLLAAGASLWRGRAKRLRKAS